MKQTLEIPVKVNPIVEVPMRQSTTHVVRLSSVGMGDVALVGGKNASLGEMIQQLTPLGLNIPNGFATTTDAFRQFIGQTNLATQLHDVLDPLNVEDVEDLRRRGGRARQLILDTPFPTELESEIWTAYEQLCWQVGEENLSVAVRSSATAEDLPDASFAGQQDTYLNVCGFRQLLEACHRCFASLFTDRAISYRVLKGFDHFDVALSVGVQQMVRSDLATSGVMFSLDTETGFEHTVLITAGYGLGETIVQGAVNPDEYLVFKPTLKEGYQPILKKRCGSKEIKMVYGDRPNHLTQTVEVPLLERQRYALTDDEVLCLAQWACQIEQHYSALRGRYSPMDIEWAKDGLTGELYIVQARPETVQSQASNTILRTYQLATTQNPVVLGQAVGESIGQGMVKVVSDPNQMGTFQAGEVLVAKRTDPDWEPIMKRASAVVTDQGGRTCHAAIIAREMGIPAVVGCGNATTTLHSHQPVTVSCAGSDVGKIYPGLIPFNVEETEIEGLPRTHTQIMMNVGNPEEALSLAAIPADGVGLARLEFIIANHIKIHPLALLHYETLADEQVKQEIATLTSGYSYKPDYFIDKLVQGIGLIAAAFFPNPVVIRLSDFKSNEYRKLLGGATFEPYEENPMLGWRGAARYTDPKYQDAFGLECIALSQVRDRMGLTNVIPMVPFCRTPEEGRNVIAEMAKYDLKQGENGLQIYAMCEIPNNVILADQFCEIFDGFSIGSNDLTQLTLGIDRDSELIAHLFDERSEGIKAMISSIIKTAKAKGCKVGICGQAPSDYPEFAEFLVTQGIDSISLNPDSVIKTTLAVADIERQLKGL